MPIRSIRVKLVVPRGDDGRPLRQSLWATHDAVNAATKFYEQRLLLMRGQSYVTADGEVGEEAVLDELRLLIGEAKVRNGGEDDGQYHEEIKLLRSLYERIVPSSIGANGTAQAAGAFIGPLTDPESKGFLGVYDKLARPIPNWVSLVEAQDQSALSVANAWLTSPNAETWMSDTGSPAGWLRLARKDDPEWPTKFVEKVADLKKEASEGIPPLVKKLRELRVLPLFPPYLTPKIEDARGTLGPWDRLALRLTVGHMLSWESWCRKSAEEHQARLNRVQEFKEQRIDEAMSEQISALRVYETEREEYLSTLGLGEASFRITPRQLRGWRDLKDKWKRSKDTNETALIDIIASEQTRLRGKFGDPDLFRWLVKPSNHGLWQGDADPVDTIATLNAMQSLVERSRETATMTFPDPAHHPRCVQWEPPGSSNLRHYTPTVDAIGDMSVTLELLEPVSKDRFREATNTLRIAPSGQLRGVELTKAGKGLKIDYRADSDEAFSGKLKSSDLLFIWSHFKNRPLAQLEDGDVGPTYLKLVIDVDKKLPDCWTDKWPPAAAHFKTALGKKTKHEDKVGEGVRVLSVDLGVRTFGSCAVFQLKENKPDDGFAFEVPIDETTMWAVHERSFLLTLPNEEVERRGQAWRSERDNDLRRMWRVLARYRRIMRMAGEGASFRGELLTELKAALDDDSFAFELDLVAPLNEAASSPQPVWDQAINDCLKAYRRDFGPLVKAWRSSNRRRENERHMGKSMWAIDYLTNTRRFLMRWSLLGRTSGDIRRLGRDKQGVFASGLLDHINHMKADRLKTGSDLIVQAARGYIRGKGGKWEQGFEPCQIVLFEDLSRYRMRTDRPRRENSQLMKWAHRGIPLEVEMQGELYGLHIVDTAAEFSSRYHARLNTPGVRSRVLAKADFENDFFRDMLSKDGIDLDDYQPGELVPWLGGEMFSCLDGDGALVRTHADINAAQNLQRRFWTRFAEPFRLPCNLVREDGDQYWVPRNLGKRLLGGMGGTGILVATGHDSGSCRWEPVTPQRYKNLGGSSGSEETASSDPDMEELEALAQAAIERSGDYDTFFRDPSGNVLPSYLWYPSKAFWSIVKAKTLKALKSGL